MNRLTYIAMTGIVSIGFLGCGDTYDPTPNTNQVQDTQANNSLKSLKRKVSYLADTSGTSVYTFDKDVLNKSNCDAECQKIWPPFIGQATQSSDIIPLANTNQLTFRKHPLYYFIKDTAPGDTNGDNVKNVWHLVYAPAGTNDTQTTFADQKMEQTYLTDKDGRALYIFDKDTTNKSNCYGGCEEIWPVYYNSDIKTVPEGLKSTDFTTITRDANQSKTGILQQTTYKGHPLYYFTPDAKKSGETKGDWVKGVWHLVELSAKKVTQTTAASPFTTQAAEKGRAIFTNPSKCAACHGADGQTKPLGVDNIIARYGDATLISSKLKDMRDNGNPQNRNPAMVNVAQGLSDEAIINLSAFVATLKK